MTLDELDDWAASFEAFHARFADLFARSESREQAKKYVRGLLTNVERKNGWQLAEVVGDATPDRTQRLLYQVKWDAEEARDRLQQFVIETFGEQDAIAVVDETGLLKKGEHSVGVQQQYSGAAGKVENCQVATVLSYASRAGHVFLDRRLYLPQEEWCWNRARRAKAKVPKEVRFQTKPEQAIAMLEHAWEQGVPMRWVTGDSVYGDAPRLGEAVQEHGKWYVLAVSSTTPVWTKRPAVIPPQELTGGRPRQLERLAPGEAKASTVAQVVDSWPKHAWKRLSVGEGEKGLREYYWARAWVVESRDRLPGPDIWLLARRSLSDPKEIAYYLALAPRSASLQFLATVAATRYTVEQCIEEGKGETGLDQYEVRTWPSWYRHITLSMMAHAWLASLRITEEGKKVTLPINSPN